MPMRPSGMQWFGEGGGWGFFSQFAALERNLVNTKGINQSVIVFYEKWAKVRLRQLRYMCRLDCARMCLCACMASSAAWLCKNIQNLQNIRLILIYNV